jgi:hypothetical protein
MQFKKIREQLLFVLAAVFSIVVVWVSVALTTFLIQRMNQSLTFESRAPRATEFDTAGFEKLKLVQEKK